MKNAPFRIALDLKTTFPTVNSFVFEEVGGGLTLIDTGDPLSGNWELLVEKLKERGYTVSDIKKVILTHEHIDHVGLLPKIMENSEAEIWASSMIKEYLVDFERLSIANQTFFFKVFKTVGFSDQERHFIEKVFNKMKSPKLEFDEKRISYFEPDDTLVFGGLEWKALHCPGHCPTQFCFFQKETKQLLSGDMLLPIVPMPIIAENPEVPGERLKSLLLMMKSFKKLLEVDFNMVYPGHGDPFSNPKTIINNQLNRIEQRKEQCLDEMTAPLNSVFELSKKLYPQKPKGLFPFNIGGLFMTLGYLDLLEDEGRIEKQQEGDTVFYKKITI